MQRTLNRRMFIKQVATATGALTSAAFLSTCHSTRKQPNILFCIADDQSFPHASVYGSTFVKTPAFDRIAHEGILFNNAFVSTPSCCPSRGSILCGQDFYRLKEGSMNHTVWPSGMLTYPDILAQAGYHTGYTGKGWAPGNWKISGRDINPAGSEYNQIKNSPPTRFISTIDYTENFRAFLNARPKSAPFCFWFGALEPHREYEEGSGIKSGMNPDRVQVPGFFPDAAPVRSDMLDYALEIEWYDRHLDRMLHLLDEIGELDNTIIIITADNGMPFPRAKANVYESGCHMPLAIRWGNGIRPRRVVEDFISFADFAPTLLQAAGVTVPGDMTGRSMLPVLFSQQSGQIDPLRDYAVFGIERHFPGSRPDGAGYPMRAIRTSDFLYVHNLTPDENPAGNHPSPVWPKDDPVGGYGDADGGMTKTYIWEQRQKDPRYFDWAFGKRPAEELYQISHDSDCLKNLAQDPAFAEIKKSLTAKLQQHLLRTKDPRTIGQGAFLDEIMKRFPRTQSER